MSKNKPPHQPNKLAQKPEPQSISVQQPAPVKIVEEIKVDDSVVKTEEVYIPSLNAEKYPVVPKKDVQYKILACRNDYVKLQEEVTKYLNDGWKLAGGVVSNMYTDNYSVTTVWAQSVYKE